MWSCSPSRQTPIDSIDTLQAQSSREAWGALHSAVHRYPRPKTEPLHSTLCPFSAAEPVSLLLCWCSQSVKQPGATSGYRATSLVSSTLVDVFSPLDHSTHHTYLTTPGVPTKRSSPSGSPALQPKVSTANNYSTIPLPGPPPTRPSVSFRSGLSDTHRRLVTLVAAAYHLDCLPLLPHASPPSFPPTPLRG